MGSFLLTFSLKYPKKNKIYYAYFTEILILLIFGFGWQSGWGLVHAGLSAASDCAMVRKVKVTNEMQELRTEEDSLEPRQLGSW